MMKCSVCGLDVRPGDKFCTHCGAPVDQQSQVNVQDQTVKIQQSVDSNYMNFQNSTENSNNMDDSTKQNQDTVENHTDNMHSNAGIPNNEGIPYNAGTPNYQGMQNQATYSNMGAQYNGMGQQPINSVPVKKKMSKTVKIILPIIVLCIIVGGIFLGKKIKNDKDYDNYYEKAMDYMDNEEYDLAITYLRKAQAIKPSSAKVKENLDTVIGVQFQSCKLDVMNDINEQDYETAKDRLQELKVKKGDTCYDEYTQLLNTVSMNPSIEKIDTSAYPDIAVTISYEGNSKLTKDMLTLQEDNETKTIESMENKNNKIILHYTANNVYYDSVNLNIVVGFNVADVNLEVTSNYDTPNFKEASMQIISTDISEYPTVKTYIRIVDSDTQTSLTDLRSENFKLRESVQGGEYLEREVRKVSQLEGNTGLNISLIADKSDSIYPEDMEKIKKVMSEFVNKLHYDEGDKAEVLAFDSIVQQMCTFTNDPKLLVNGINNMSTDGLTAFYDALYDGVHHAALQGGARCVIAFTDGDDNSSRYYYDDIIEYANENQVTLYIIGVGYSDNYVLQDMAHSTNGEYWDINNLYDLEDIFNTIYQQQKQLYVVEYETDKSAHELGTRDVQLNLCNESYKGECYKVFTPVKTIKADDKKRDQRYEIFVEDISWEDAARKCQEMGGHLATITSKDEMNEIIKLAESKNITYVWLGGYTSYDDDGNVFGHWVTGEDFSYSAWCDGEPSRTDLDGTPEWYITLWKVKDKWSWNDQRNDIVGDFETISGKLAYVCEYE